MAPGLSGRQGSAQYAEPRRGASGAAATNCETWAVQAGLHRIS
mgnify:CR=1 FL=1